MISARQSILTAVRAALGREQPLSGEDVAAERERRLTGPLPRPVWQGERLARFTERFEQAAGTWDRIAESAAIPAAVAAYLDTNGPIRLRRADHPLLRDLDWPDGWEIATDGPDVANWPAAITVAYAGIADTGSVVMPSGPQRPTSLNFLPDRHIVVLRAADVVDYMESVWERLLGEGGGLPRTVNVITGPSRTADVEQTLQLGAHGPRHLHLLLLD